jgi:precorrin-2 dehydrogenase/sirohydrochlorin ferrochelatase
MSQYYPIFMDLRAKQVLVVGGGSVALRKVQILLKHGALVHLVSPPAHS